MADFQPDILKALSFHPHHLKEANRKAQSHPHTDYSK
jgi:hypothetical protein